MGMVEGEDMHDAEGDVNVHSQMAGLSLRHPYVIQRKPLTAMAEYGSSGRSDVVLQSPHT